MKLMFAPLAKLRMARQGTYLALIPGAALCVRQPRRSQHHPQVSSPTAFRVDVFPGRDGGPGHLRMRAGEREVEHDINVACREQRVDGQLLQSELCGKPIRRFRQNVRAGDNIDVPEQPAVRRIYVRNIAAADDAHAHGFTYSG